MPELGTGEVRIVTREQQYKAQMETLGTYDPAFDPAIHTLAVMERELQRTMKAWKATAPGKNAAPSTEHKLYAVIQTQRKDILAHRDALGLTPKALRRLRGVEGSPAGDPVTDGIGARLDVIARRCGL